MSSTVALYDTTAQASWAGAVAQWLSLGCAVHCMAMPFLVAALPLMGMGFLLDERVETAVILGSAALATFSVTLGYRVHRRSTVLKGLSLAVLLLVVGRVAPPGPIETAFTAAGAFTLAGTQFWNRRLSKPCRCCVRAEEEVGS